MAMLERLRQINRTAAFNRFAGSKVSSCGDGSVPLSMPWRDELGQYAGLLHAGVIAALFDTACGFAAVSVSGKRVLASHFGVNCVRPAAGASCRAWATVVKPARTQIFTRAELYAQRDGAEKLVATGETILSVLDS